MNLGDVSKVSRETMERLECYADLLRRWNRKINLVAPSTLDDLEERHFVDSIQLTDHAPTLPGTWLDLGSGGGFPGLVIAIVYAERTNGPKVRLVESDARKCAFLRTVLREVGVSAEVITDRIENVPPQHADIVTARALAPLTTLIGYCEHHLAVSGTALFLKGENWRDEVAVAQSRWCFDLQTFKSSTSAEAQVLKISGVSRV